jgi:hypothetical protein
LVSDVLTIQASPGLEQPFANQATGLSDLVDEPKMRAVFMLRMAVSALG